MDKPKEHRFKGQTYGRTSIRFSKAPARSGNMTSHSCFAALLVAVDAILPRAPCCRWRRLVLVPGRTATLIPPNMDWDGNLCQVRASLLIDTLALKAEMEKRESMMLDCCCSPSFPNRLRRWASFLSFHSPPSSPHQHLLHYSATNRSSLFRCLLWTPSQP